MGHCEARSDEAISNRPPRFARDGMPAVMNLEIFLHLPHSQFMPS